MQAFESDPVRRGSIMRFCGLSQLLPIARKCQVKSGVCWIALVIPDIMVCLLSLGTGERFSTRGFYMLALSVAGFLQCGSAIPTVLLHEGTHADSTG